MVASNTKGVQEIKATIKSKTEKQTSAGERFWAFSLQCEGQDKALTYSLFDHKAGQEVQVGQTWRLRVSEKPNPKGGVYHNIDGVIELVLAEDGPLAEPEGHENGGAVPRRASERVSIERQTSLKAAVELAGYRIAQGKDMLSSQVLQVASVFAQWIATGVLPKEKGGDSNAQT